jgi:hypothetical protein
MARTVRKCTPDKTEGGFLTMTQRIIFIERCKNIDISKGGLGIMSSFSSPSDVLHDISLET